MKIQCPTSIAILMATYNGETFLQAQIESIRNQSYTDWTLYIQDDGSSDRTTAIIHDFQQKDARITCVDLGLTHQGAGSNFMSLLNLVEAPYYMFCDQDDVWFSHKIVLSFHRMRELEKENSPKPIIVHTDRTYVDANLQVKLASELNPHHISPHRLEKKLKLMKQEGILNIYTIVAGCTMIFNRAVKAIVFPYINVRVHDSICVMAVAKHRGIIDTVTESTMYYRLHGHNTCGVTDKRLAPKIFHFMDSYRRNMRGYYIWQIYGNRSFLRFLYYRIKYFLILRFY